MTTASIVIDQGATLDLRVLLKTGSTPVDVTDWTATARFKTSDGTTLISLTSVTVLDYTTSAVYTTGASGYFYVIVAADVTETWSLTAKGTFGLMAKDTDDRVMSVVKGTWSMAEPVADAPA